MPCDLDIISKKPCVVDSMYDSWWVAGVGRVLIIVVLELGLFTGWLSRTCDLEEIHALSVER